MIHKTGSAYRTGCCGMTYDYLQVFDSHTTRREWIDCPEVPTVALWGALKADPPWVAPQLWQVSLVRQALHDGHMRTIHEKFPELDCEPGLVRIVLKGWLRYRAGFLITTSAEDIVRHRQFAGKQYRFTRSITIWDNGATRIEVLAERWDKDGCDCGVGCAGAWVVLRLWRNW